jgi:hypothetical protein
VITAEEYVPEAYKDFRTCNEVFAYRLPARNLVVGDQVWTRYGDLVTVDYHDVSRYDVPTVCNKKPKTIKKIKINSCGLGYQLNLGFFAGEHWVARDTEVVVLCPPNEHHRMFTNEEPECIGCP